MMINRNVTIEPTREKRYQMEKNFFLKLVFFDNVSIYIFGLVFHVQKVYYIMPTT